MNHHSLIVALDTRRYRVERPFGSWPRNSGFVSDVAVDQRGHVFVLLRHDPLTDPDDPRIIELDPSGTLITSWGGAQIADSHLMTFAANGDLLVVDRDMHEIVVFSGAGERRSSFGKRGVPLSPFNHPSDVAVSGWGDIYVSDGYAASHIHRFNASGTHLSTWGEPGSAPGQFGEPHALWTLRDRRVVVVDRVHHRLQVFGAEGDLLDVWGDFYRPVSIWGDQEDRLYVVDSTPCLHLIAPDGTRLGRCRPVLNGAHGLSGNAAGDLFLAESNPSRVTRLVLLRD
jgi:hypothetical protein